MVTKDDFTRLEFKMDEGFANVRSELDEIKVRLNSNFATA